MGGDGGQGVSKGLLSGVSIELGREIQQRHRWAEGKEQGIPGYREADFSGSQSCHPFVWASIGPASTHADTARRNAGSDGAEEKACKSEAAFRDNFLPEAPEDDGEAGSFSYLLRQRV